MSWPDMTRFKPQKNHLIRLITGIIHPVIRSQLHESNSVFLVYRIIVICKVPVAYFSPWLPHNSIFHK